MKVHRHVQKYLVDNKMLQVIMQVAGLLVVLLNLWIASKLAPISKDLAVVTNRVDAIDNTIHDHVTQNEFNRVITRLERIENKIDNLK